ncbi:hypothetical protein D0T84_16550 [Dysgonomonas sp. 521]|nr:hypothetical protein [Dysgonomonas sp. 521]
MISKKVTKVTPFYILLFCYFLLDNKYYYDSPPRPLGTPGPTQKEKEKRGESRKAGDRCRFARQALFPFDKGKYPKGEGLELIYKFLSCTVINLLYYSQDSKSAKWAYMHNHRFYP